MSLRGSRSLSVSAIGYLSELERSAQYLLWRKSMESLQADGLPLRELPGSLTLSTPEGEEGVSSPSLEVDRWVAESLRLQVRTAYDDLVRLAWWYAMAALTALRAVVNGQPVTARDLERASARLMHQADPAHVYLHEPQFRLPLDDVETLRIGIVAEDHALTAVVERLRQAYDAIDAAGDPDRTMRDTFPGLLIAVARCAADAALAVNRQPAPQ